MVIRHFLLVNRKLRVEKIDEADVKLVMSQTQCMRHESINALHKHHGDLLGAILEIAYNREGLGKCIKRATR